jgi:hypothetical protein
MDPLLRLISAAYLNAILEPAGVLGDLHVQDVTIISDRPTLVSRIIRLRLTYDGPANGLPGSLIVKTGLTEQRGTEWSNGRQEVAFYSDVAPSLPAGEAHHADATTPWYLVLEDLTDTHALATDRCLRLKHSAGRSWDRWPVYMPHGGRTRDCASRLERGSTMRPWTGSSGRWPGISTCLQTASATNSQASGARSMKG